jgi:hypothetical protein
MSLMVIDPYKFAVAGDTFISNGLQDVMTWSSVDGSSGVTYTRSQSSTYYGGGVGGGSSLADMDDGDYQEWFVNLTAGTYTLTVVRHRTTASAIVRFSLDGTSLGTADFYGATAVNIVDTITGITVAADGNYTLRAAADGKNASSTDYQVSIQALSLTRTGA